MVTLMDVLSVVFNPLVVIIGLAVIIGLWSKFRRKIGTWEAVQVGNASAIMFTAMYFAILFFMTSGQVPQEISAQVAVPSLIFALMTIATSNLADITGDRRHANMSKKVTKIYDDTQLILKQIALMQQNPSQQTDSQVFEISQSNNGDDNPAISTN